MARFAEGCGYRWSGIWTSKIASMGMIYSRRHCSICDSTFNHDRLYGNPTLEHIYQEHKDLFFELYMQGYIKERTD